MTKPSQRKRSESEVVSEVMLRGAAINYAAVAKLDSSHPKWRRYWRKLRRAAIGMVAEIRKAAEPPEGTHRRGRWCRADPQLRRSRTPVSAHGL